jgi:hypothetical protein
MTVRIPADRICDAADWETYTFSIFGNPKMKMICGKCYRPFESRDYSRYNRGEGLAMCCPHCGMWNVARGITFND